MTQITKAIQHLRGALLLGEGADLTDGQLLESFISRREQAALEALVRRHGPMVWGVCCRILHNHHDTEDAFQATFLVLVRKAASVTPREMVGNWLYGVAHQTALKARATAAKRRAREMQVMDMPEPAVKERDFSSDLQAVLDQELSRLPDKYRVAIVLCDLDGKTRKEAARQLGLPEGTLAGRQTRGRAMLAKRLARHGQGVSGVSLATMLSQNVAAAGVPTSVLSSTIKAATLVASGQAAATGVISARVAALTEGVLKTMLLTKLKIATVVLFLVGFSAFTYGIMAPGQEREPLTQVAKKQTPKEEEPLRGNPSLPIDDLRGKWTGEKNGIKVDLTFDGEKANLRGNWRVQFKHSPKVVQVGQLPALVGIEADMKCVADVKGKRLHLWLESAEGREKPVGEVQRGAEGTILLRIIPIGKKEDVEKGIFDYPAVEGLILRRVPMTDPKDAIDALDKKYVRLERDKSGFVIHARLPAEGILLDEATPHLKRLPKLAGVACHADNLSTDGFRQLAALRSLVELEVHANKFCPVMPWKDLHTVRTVRLSGGGIDDALLEAVGGMPAVTSLHLNGVAVTPNGLAHLKQLRGLESVLIQSSKVTADGVKSLIGIEKLRSLTLCGNDIGAAGFAHLGTLTRLEYLNLESTRCTDDDVARLRPLANLTDLDLGYNPGVTDAGLRHLAGLKKLVGLRLYETKVTDDGWRI
jgi:RNA polymerase sigma factor (sigma-70 family)